MTRTSRACGLIVVYSLLAGLLACGIASAQEINPDFTEGVKLFQQRSYNAAISKLEDVTEAEPDNEAAWYYLGVARYEQDDFEEALDALQKAYDFRPGRPGTQFYIGQIYEQLGAFDEAVRAYQTELRNRRFKNLAEVFMVLGRAYYYSGRYYDAVETLTEALDHNENYVEAFFYRGLAEYMREQYDDALRDFDAAIAVVDEWDRKQRRLESMIEREGEAGLSPEAQRTKQEIQEELAQEYARAAEFAQDKAMRPALYIAKGDNAVAMEEFGQARNAYRKALDADRGGNPADPLPQVRIGVAYFEEAQSAFYQDGLLWTAIKTVDAGIYAIEDALEDAASYPEAHKALGDIFLFQAKTYVSDPDRDVISSDYEDALARYNAAIEVNPDYAEAYRGRAETYMAMDQPAEAIDDLRTAMELDPRNPELYGALAMAQMLDEQYQEAMSTAQVALNVDPDNAQAHNAAGLAYYYTGQLGAASEHFNKAVEADPTLHQSFTNLGNTFYQMGSWNRARMNYDRALELIPKPAIANTAIQRSYLHYLVAKTYHNMGMYDREVESLGNALGLDAAYLDALMQLAMAYTELDQFQAAEQALRTALEVSPGLEEDAAIHVQMGRLYEEEGRPYEAITAYGAALDAQSDNLEAREALKRLTSS
ncbi:MAG: tetratricopeptide repeat protein [Armatimonadia bacterium]|nr:tetratricopeptide repeat protein [Armatimonadia bacterium]